MICFMFLTAWGAELGRVIVFLIFPDLSANRFFYFYFWSYFASGVPSPADGTCSLASETES